MFRIKTFLFFFLLTFGLQSSAQIPLSQKAEVSILTCGTGPEVYALFGHTAIRINDAERGLDIVYNYGMFDFGTPNFIGKFTKGDLQYFMGTTNFSDFMSQYEFEQRSVYEQKLQIPFAKKQQIFDNLNKALLSDARFYTYKFIDRNCTNMAVDVVNKTLGGKIIYKRKNTDVTYRETLYPYFNGHFYEQLGTSIIFGTKVDKQATLLFLPFELLESLKVSAYDNRLLAQETNTLLEFKDKENPRSWWNNIYTYLAFLVLVVVLNKKMLNIFYFLLLGLIGLFFSVAGMYSLHEELAWNYNVLLLNPVFLVLLYFYVKNNQKWLYKISLLLMASIFVYLILIVTKPYFLIVLPMVVANVILLGRFVLPYRKQLKANV